MKHTAMVLLLSLLAGHAGAAPQDVPVPAAAAGAFALTTLPAALGLCLTKQAPYEEFPNAVGLLVDYARTHGVERLGVPFGSWEAPPGPSPALDDPRWKVCAVLSAPLDVQAPFAVEPLAETQVAATVCAATMQAEESCLAALASWIGSQTLAPAGPPRRLAAGGPAGAEPPGPLAALVSRLASVTYPLSQEWRDTQPLPDELQGPAPRRLLTAAAAAGPNEPPVQEPMEVLILVPVRPAPPPEAQPAGPAAGGAATTEEASPQSAGAVP